MKISLKLLQREIDRRGVSKDPLHSISIGVGHRKIRITGVRELYGIVSLLGLSPRHMPNKRHIISHNLLPAYLGSKAPDGVDLRPKLIELLMFRIGNDRIARIERLSLGPTERVTLVIVDQSLCRFDLSEE